MEADLHCRQLKIPAPQRQTYKLKLIDRLRAFPGVEGVAGASVVRLSGYGWAENVSLAGATKRVGRHSLLSHLKPWSGGTALKAAGVRPDSQPADFLRAKDANGCEAYPEESKHGEELYQNAGGGDGRYVIDS